MLHLTVTYAVVMLFILITGASGTTITVGHGGCDYNNIQAAIDKASPGDIIEVMNGTYNESIDIKKQLILLGIDMPVLDANRNTSAITLRVDRCTIKGFKVINSANRGISLLSDFNTISNNTLMDDGNGIYLEKSRNNIITYNDIRSGGWLKSGLILESSDYNIIKGNDVSYKGFWWGSGITLVNSNYNNLTDNKASADGGGSAVYLDSF
jgi:parallel beta-helix repeat protein